jgi:hypothetical protein
MNGSGSATGSPFNQSVSKPYAGNPGTKSQLNSNQSSLTGGHAVSQYDNACAQSQLH